MPDGDTLILIDGRSVRLVGIDAPEVAHGDAPAQFGAEAARALLSRLVEGVALTIRLADTPKDRYGRLLAEVVLPGGRSAQAELIRAGLAHVYFFADQNESQFGELLPLQRRAMEEGRGVWPRVLEIGAGRGGFVGNVRSHRFGPARCAVVEHIAKHNRRNFGTARVAFWYGYSPYRECGWWPAAPAGSGF